LVEIVSINKKPSCR